MLSRLARATAAVLIAGAAATSCTATPEPTETAPGFASEAEAFAAAEETYRAYVDALNAVDLSDPETFEAVYAWTTGEANANERTNLSTMHADGWTVDGRTVVENFDGTDFSADVVKAVACVDVSTVTLLDASHSSAAPGDRPDRYALALRFSESSQTRTGLQIQASNAVEDPTCG